MSRVLLVDTNLAANPLYQILIQQGHDVFVVGGNPLDYLAQVSPNYIAQNYADSGRIRTLIEELKIDYLIPGCNDFSYSVCAELSEQVGFSGIDTTSNVHVINNKQQFRQFALANNIPVPAMIGLADVENQLPVIVKPVDSYSGRGVTVIRKSNLDKLQSAVEVSKKESRSGQYLLEQYVEGQLFSHSAFLKDRKILLDFIVEEQCIASPFAVDTSRVTDTIPVAIVDRIRAVIEFIAERLQLKDGLFHTQFILQGDDFWIIEVTRRCPGDLYSLLIEYSSGYRYAQMYLNPFLGHPQTVIGEASERYVVRHTMTVPNALRLTQVTFHRPLAFLGYFPLARAGDWIERAPSGRIGTFFIESNSLDQHQVVYDALIGRSLYDIR